MSDRIQAITMPKWGMTMTEGKLAGWLAPEGADVATGQEIMEVETEKITNVVESQGRGRLRRIVVSEGATAPVGDEECGVVLENQLGEIGGNARGQDVVVLADDQIVTRALVRHAARACAHASR